MKRFAFVLVAVTVVVAAALSQAAVEPVKPEVAPEAAALRSAKALLKTELDRLSYSAGLNMVRTMKKQGVQVAPAAFLRGVADGLNGVQPLMGEPEMGQALQQMRETAAARVREMSRSGAENLERGREFLAENGTKEGVVTLPSGLQYRVVTAGDGPSPASNDTVTVNYRGTLIDGTEFDSSYESGRPASFKVGQVIDGWKEALLLMNRGARWQLFIPADLAYGKRGVLPTIGPNEVLIFEVELVDIKRGMRLNPQN